MPVEFLSDEQASRYGRFSEEPNREQLDGHFFLDERDLGLVCERRDEWIELGAVEALWAYPLEHPHCLGQP